MLNTHQLNVFLTAAETLSFSEAARRLHMSQPSVSQHIQSLERHFDRELFIRSGRQVILSDAGRALVPLAREMVNRLQVIEETMRSLDGGVFGHLLVGCSTTPGKYILPSAGPLSSAPSTRQGLLPRRATGAGVGDAVQR